jgi:urease accessory protein
MKKQVISGVLLALFSTLALAHPGHGLSSAYAGFMHPLMGWDHVLMMLAVGVWASKLSGNARWQLPLTFLSAMTIGSLLGLAGFSFAGVETAIAASVMAMGLLLVIHISISAIIRIGIVALFAVLHGMAHGIELHVQQSYAALGGMLIATALLHYAGFLLGSQRIKWVKWLQSSLPWVMLLTSSYVLLS